MSEYIIGIDAGGTKTTATAYSLDGSELLSEVGGFGNLTVDFSAGIGNIIKTVDSLIEKQGGKPKFICLGCAGIETGNNKALAQKELESKYPCKVFCTNDAMLALYSALKGQDGVLIIAGTGSIGYLKKGDKVYRSGGWGHLINDDGSGYSIGIKAIRAVTDGFDNGKPESALKQALFKKLNISQIKELIGFVYKAEKADIADLVPTVEAVASAGDREAEEILLWAGDCLAESAARLLRLYSPNGSIVAISGSVIKKTAVVNARFRKKLAELSPTIVDEGFTPQKGGYYIYKEQIL